MERMDSDMLSQAKLTSDEMVSGKTLNQPQNIYEKYQNIYSIIKTIEYLVGRNFNEKGMGI
jgi:hypothetical protein